MKFPEDPQQKLGDIQERAKEAGISPVVGAILMVAITVVLAAVLMVVVTDMAGQVSPNPQASVYITDTPTGVELTLYAVSNADSIEVKVGDDVLHRWDLDGTEERQISLIGVSTDDQITIVGSADGNERVLTTHTPEFDIEPSLNPQLGAIENTPEAHDSLVILAGDVAYSNSTVDGDSRWERAFSHYPRYAANTTYVVTGNVDYYADTTDIELWSTKTGSKLATSYQLSHFSDGLLLDDDGSLYSIDVLGASDQIRKVEVTTGTEQWSSADYEAVKGFALHDGLVHLHYEDATGQEYVAGLDASDGSQLWDNEVNGYIGDPSITSSGNALYRVDSEYIRVSPTGDVTTLNIDSNSLVENNNMFYASPSVDTVVVYDETGTEIETHSVSGKIMAVDKDGSFYTGDGNVHKYSPNGTFEYTLSLPKWVGDSAPVVFFDE